MSMPNIPNITPLIQINREDALNMLLASIALEEMGLAHIINAEGEKVQYVLDSKIHHCASLVEIKEINLGVERIIRETMKLQMLLQEKLESVISLIPKSTPPAPSPCPQPIIPDCIDCRPACSLTGRARGSVSNKTDFFYCGTAAVDSSIYRIEKDKITLSLKYALCVEKDDQIVSVHFLAIPESIDVHCSSGLKSYPLIKNCPMLVMQGQGIISGKGMSHPSAQCSATFTLTVWGSDCNQKFQMVICSPNPEFNHNSGLVSVASGNLEIIKCHPEKTDMDHD